MSTTEINPLKIKFGVPPGLNVMLKDSIQEHGLEILPEMGETIAVREADVGAYKVVRGGKAVGAIQSLIEDNTECFDPETSKAIPARELYAKVTVQLMG